MHLIAADSPEAAAAQALDIVALHDPLGVGELSFTVIQAVDLVRLQVEPQLQMAFVEVELKRDRTTFTTVAFNEFRPGLVRQSWSIAPSVADALPGHWTRLATGATAGKVRIPLRRWGLAMQRRWDDDRLIDCWVALEGLYGSKSDRTSIPEALARHIAKDLGLTALEQATLATELRDSYNVRTDIAHGRDYKEADVDRAVASADRVLMDCLHSLI